MKTASARDRYNCVQDRIARACAIAHRPVADVTLVAVSKFKPVEAIQELYDLGHRDFGESRVQEMVQKSQELPKDIRWHFIGPLQSNKAAKAASVSSLIHSIDSIAQIKKFNAAVAPVPVLIEINIAQEPQKGGIFSKSLDEFAETVLHYPQAHLRGLMTIGPVVEHAEEMRRYFAELRSLGDQLRTPVLSMGMSQDFEVAIQEGSTHVRVGTALFGER